MSHMWVLGMEPRPLEERQVLLASDLSTQPLKFTDLLVWDFLQRTYILHFFVVSFGFVTKIIVKAQSGKYFPYLHLLLGWEFYSFKTNETIYKEIEKIQTGHIFIWMIPSKSHNIPIYIKICIFYYVHVSMPLGCQMSSESRRGH